MNTKQITGFETELYTVINHCENCGIELNSNTGISVISATLTTPKRTRCLKCGKGVW